MVPRQMLKEFETPSASWSSSDEGWNGKSTAGQESGEVLDVNPADPDPLEKDGKRI
jgi:hypothetical protein